MAVPDSITIENVCYSYGKHQVLHNIDLRVPPGQIYGLLGPSGCGKTTLVKIIAGILEASTGQVGVLGQPIPNLNTMQRIGYMAQSDALYLTLSAEQNLRFFATLYSLPKKQLPQRIDAVMRLVNLQGELKKPVAAYSGGMKRRLSLALALLHNPTLLLLDEPTVGIDPMLRQEIWRELHQLSAQGVTILVTTHVMDEAAKCHQLAMIREGRLIAQGSCAQLIEESGQVTIEDAFIHYGGGS